MFRQYNYQAEMISHFLIVVMIEMRYSQTEIKAGKVEENLTSTLVRRYKTIPAECIIRLSPKILKHIVIT